ncbi:MAG: insulinase family protein [Candidatus Omnitrophica bacterium]|nr:insulinase family protein [Candidatus Omnitrophota bacterium]
MENGLVVLIKESHKLPLVAIEARIKSGSSTEQQYEGSGISHFVEHMLFKGTKNIPTPGAIEKQIKLLGGYINGFASYDSTGFQIIVPAEHLNSALEILKDILTEPLFNPHELEKERNVILKEIRLNRDEPTRYLSLLLWSNVFKAHSYRFPIIGYEPLFKKLKRKDLLHYYKTRYIPDNIILGIVGDVNTEIASKTVEVIFGGIARSFPIQAYCQHEPPQITAVEVEEEREISLAYLAMGFRSVAIRDKDLFSLDVLSIILGEGEDSRLFNRLYRQKKIVYSIGSSNYTLKDPGIFVVNAVLKKEDIQTAMAEIWKQIEDLKTKPITEQELEKAKNQVLSAYIFSRQTIQSEVSDLVNGEMLTGDYDFSKKYVEGIRKVTAAMVRDVATRYLKRESVTVVKLLPKEEEAKRVVEKSSSVLAVSKIERYELENGLKVLLYKDPSLPIISLTAVGLGGLRTENFGNNGISNLVSDALLCGTKKRNEEEISSKIEGVGATLNPFSGNNTFGLSASCLDKHIDLIFEIFSDVLQNPEFNQQKLEREKSVIYGEIKSIEDDISQCGIRTLKYVLFKRHPYRFQTMGRASTIKRFTQRELLDYHSTYYRPNNMVLAVSGNFDRNKVRKKIHDYFGKFEKMSIKSINPPPEKKNSKPRLLTRNVKKEQSLILLGYLGTTIDNHDEDVLEVLCSILSGTNGRLAQKIREEKGLAYALGVKSIAGIENGLIIFYIATTKENLNIATTELFKEIELLKNEGVSDGELRAAKNELIGLQRMWLQRSQDVAMRAALDELYGLGYDNFLKYEERIRRITKECVLRAAKKYLTTDSYVLLILKGT